MHSMEDTTNRTPDQQPTEDRFFIFKRYVKNFLKDALDLEHGVDKRMTINEIKDKKSMSGANAWMLMCSIVIASVGLNMNSPAVIIGAMLISPLMSPILGMGLAIGINDKDTLKKSLAHFAMAVLIALITSTLYFLVTPLKEVTEQIAARTEPTPLDIFIAFFGGIAGIVSIARKDISTTLPGVAIATALMPPLCVTGFGIANLGEGDGYGEIALWSFFLFFINTVFVSFATFLIVRFVLKFPQKDFENPQDQRKNTIYISLFLLAITVISFFPFRKLLKDRNDKIKLELFIDHVFEGRRTLLDGMEYISHGDSALLVLKVYGDSEDFYSEERYGEICEEFGLTNTRVQIVSTTNINEKDLKELDNKILSIKDATDQINMIQEQKRGDDTKVKRLETQLRSFYMPDSLFVDKSRAIRALYQDDIKGVSYAKGQSTSFDKETMQLPIYIIDWKVKAKNYQFREKQISGMLNATARVDSLMVVHAYR